MASFCVLHKDPVGAGRAFSALPAPGADPLEFASARRARLWELSPSLHCSIVGTCLTASELRRFFVRFGEFDARTAGDHDLHGRGVLAASRRDDGGSLLNKALDKRHEGAIRRFAKAETAIQLRALWKQALDQGDIGGPYWAAITHPAADAKVVQDIFGDVHMLSHQVGAAARLDIARLRGLEAELGERSEKIMRQQARLAAAAAERAALRETIERLESRLAGYECSPAAPAPIEIDERLRDLTRQLEAETARAHSLAGKLEISEEKRVRAEAESRAAKREADRSRRELTALEAALGPREGPAETRDFGDALRDVKVLYVGGRPKLIDQLAAFAVARGGALIAHDGGVEDNLALLPGLVSQADVVCFPVDCVSHSAAEKVKKLCQRLAKPWAPLRSASLASFVSEIPAITDLRRERSRTAAE